MPVKVNVKKFSRSKEIEPVAETSEIIQQEQPIEQPTAEDNIDNDSVEIEADDFLDALTNDKYVNKKTLEEEKKQKELEAKEKDKQKKESLKQMKEFEKARVAEEKARIAAEKQNKKSIKDDLVSVGSNDIYSSNHSIIIGKEKRILMNKVQSYKELFKEELKGFKIKKNCSTEELKDYIAEMDCIIETGTVETFYLYLY